MHRDVVFGERGIHDPARSRIEPCFLHKGETKPHDDATAELAQSSLGFQDAPAIERTKKTAHSYLASHRIHAYFAEHRAVAVHRPVLELHRRGSFRFDADFCPFGAG